MTAHDRSHVVDADRLIPDLLQEHPEARRVLDRHGLRGCGGPMGPYETLRYFARAHGIDEERLLGEIDEAIAHPESGEPELEPEEGHADAIYRPYFLAAIAVVLTAGATWGAWILWNIGLTGSFRAASVHQVNAHGEAQIYGWVGLFIMGFAAQAFPRIWHTRLVAPRLAMAALGLMLGGIVVRTIGMAAAGTQPWATGLAALGGGLQIVATTLFTAQIAVTFRRSGQGFEPYVAFIAVSLACFVSSSIYSTWHTWRVMTAGDAEQLVDAISTYQLPLRDLQVHGLALFMILGVSIRMLPGLFDVPKVGDRRGWWAFGLLTAGLIGEIVMFLAYRWTENVRLAACLVAAWLVMAVAIGMIVVPWRLWKPMPEADRSDKFIRTAYLWLAIAVGMLLFMPLYMLMVKIPFSHAYFGAARHAITVGFVSLMIMGMAAKVVPTLNGIDPKSLGSLRGPFILVNLGCTLRVVLQILTDWTDHAYHLIGVSGTLEVIGLSWWGLGLAAIILGARSRAGAEESADSPRPARIEGSHRVADVLAWYPDAEAVFLKYGFHALRNPVLRRTMARQVTINQAARLKGVDAALLLDALNALHRQAALPELAVIDAAGVGTCPSHGDAGHVH